MKVRKNTIFIITNDVKTTLKLFKDIKTDKLIKRQDEISFIVNDYQIHIKTSINESTRGYKPEIVYLFNDTMTTLEVLECVIKPQCNMSTRKEPVRLIDSISDIDVLEILYDDIAMSKCDLNKLKRFNELRTN